LLALVIQEQEWIAESMSLLRGDRLSTKPLLELEGVVLEIETAALLGKKDLREAHPTRATKPFGMRFEMSHELSLGW
jgi:hypothetical protein